MYNMAYVNSEAETEVNVGNELEKTNEATIHLSATDGKTVAEATQLVFHKMEDGELFIEYFLHEAYRDKVIANPSHFQTNLSKEAKQKLIDFLNDPTTY